MSTALFDIIKATTLMPEAMALPEKEAVDQLKAELDKGTDINTLDQWGGSALIMACMEDKPEIAAFLLDQKADVTIADNSDKRTALHYAANNSMTEIVKRLIDAGLDINQQDVGGLTPLVLNVLGARDKFGITNAKVTDASGNNVPDHPMVKAISHKNENVIKTAQLLIDSGANVTLGPKNQGPLFNAGESNNVELLQILIKAGADVNAQDETTLRPLHYAARRSATNTVLALIKAGAGVNAQDQYGFTALMEAVLANSADLVKALLDEGADASLKLTKGYKPYTNNETAIDIASDKGFAEIVQILEASTA